MIRPNVRAALDYLDQILSRGGEDARDLWDVLSALRGPDNMTTGDEKNNVTVPIRRAAFPLSNKTVYTRDFPCVKQRASFGLQSHEYPYKGDGDAWGVHFFQHGYRAAVALGLVEDGLTKD